MKKEMVTILQSFDDALESLSYALEFISCNTDIEKAELSLMLCHTYGGIKSLADYHRRITNDILSSGESGE
ncbi:MAG: hypothetical protein OSJ61_23230 [Lachnospiraceae bacterium]|nr:hypothetical protein [Lachnospiraceae bacterium]